MSSPSDVCGEYSGLQAGGAAALPPLGVAAGNEHRLIGSICSGGATWRGHRAVPQPRTWTRRRETSYKFLLRPTAKQAAALEACLEDTRQLYNAALEERREAWRMGRHRVTFYSQDAQLKDIRAADPEQYGRWAFNCERAALRRLDRAFQAFFRRVKAGEKPGYPRFKGRGWWDSIEWPEHGNGCKMGFGPAPDGDPRLPQGHRPRPRPSAPGSQGPRQDDHGQAGAWPLVRGPVLRRRSRRAAGADWRGRSGSTWASRRS